MVQLASLPFSLRIGLQPKTEYRYPEDGGAVLVEVPWELPAVITEAMIADAKAVIPAYEAALAPAGRQEVGKWLTALGTLVAGRLSAEDAKVKISAYLELLTAPACSLTRESLAEAGRRFTWFPSFGEVQEFLDEAARPTKGMLHRLRMLAAAPPTPKVAEEPFVPWSKRTPEEKERFEQMMAKARAKLSGDAAHSEHGPGLKVEKHNDRRRA